MKISENEWNNYISRLKELNVKAANSFRAYLKIHGYGESALRYAYAIVTKYGEGTGALAAEMYDRIAELQGVVVPPAEVAKTATYEETRKAIRSIDTTEQQINGIKSLVKQVSSYTMIQNANRDGAEFAWVSIGDTCPFCLLLASNGWRRAGKKTIDGSHALHIHANCDCEYAIRFKPLTIAGYDPDKIYDKLNSQEGRTWEDKINSLRRKEYAENKDIINAQKREAYARRKAETSGE